MQYEKRRFIMGAKFGEDGRPVAHACEFERPLNLDWIWFRDLDRYMCIIHYGCKQCLESEPRISYVVSMTQVREKAASLRLLR